MNIADVFAANARAHPDHPAVEDGERVVSYGELEALANTAAANLLKEGIEPGDIVGLALPGCVEHVTLFWALASIGAVIFSIDGQLLHNEREVADVRQRLKVVITDETAPRLLLEVRTISMEAICAQNRQDALTVDCQAVRADHPLRCVQSSGTTGTPKSFLLTHGQVGELLLHYETYAGWTWRDRYVSIIEMNFAWGCSLCLAALYLAATIVIDHRSTVAALVDFVRKKQITVTVLTPAQLRPLLAYAAGKPLLFPLMRSMLVGSAPITPRERIAARKHLTPNFIDAYGTNEITWISVATPADQDAHPQSVGRLVDGLEAQVVDGNHQPLPLGDTGLIRFRSSRIAASYQHDREANARCFRDGWFYPMDLAAISEDGYLFLKGRADDLLSFDGIKFYPIEVENVLLSHPNVTEAAVFGWPHEQHGEIAVAAVVTSAPVSYEDLAAFIQSRLANYKIPRTILFMPRMPRNPMGKILKTKLKNIMRKKLAKQPLRQRVRIVSRAED